MSVKPLENLNRAMVNAFGGAQSYLVLGRGTTLGAGVRHLHIFNPSDSKMVLMVHDIRVVNLTTAALAGTAEEFEVRRTTLAPDTGGTNLTPFKFNSRQADLHVGATVIATAVGATGVTMKRGGTVAGGASEEAIFPIVIGTDEVTPTTAGQTGADLMFPFGFGVGPFDLNPNEGLTVVQIDAGTLGELAWWFAYSVLPIT